MKKALSLILCLIFIVSAFCGCGKEKTSAAKSNIITTADELSELSKNPDKRYILGANIDLGGKEWTPIEDFSGTLTGVWGGEFNYTISNFKLKGEKDDKSVGFFATLSGKIKNVNFKDVKLELADGFSGKAGIVAGESTEKIENVKAENCTVTGSANDADVGIIAGSTKKDISSIKTSGKITLSLSGKSNVGGIVGSGDKLQDSECDTALDITVNKGTALIGGIAGDCGMVDTSYYGGRLNLKADSKAELFASQFGGNEDSASICSYANARSVEVSGEGEIVTGTYNCTDNPEISLDCVTRDLNNLEETVLSDTEYSLRKTAVQKMYDQCSIPWTPSKDMESTFDLEHKQYYYKGQWYFGLPYAHPSGSIERMKAYLDKNNMILPSVSTTGWDKIIGNDCSDCVMWALQTVSASPCYEFTTGMIYGNGLVSVGEYEVLQDQKGYYSTVETCKATTAEAMYENYAQLMLGDAIVWGPDGHTRLVAENAYVYRNEDGSINGEKSYIVTHEQGAGTKALPERHTTCRLFGKYTFSLLFEKSYIPVTVPEYYLCKKSEYVFENGIKGDTFSALKQSAVSCNFRINYVTLTVKDGDKTVKSKTVYPCVGKHNTKYELSGIVDNTITSDLKDKKEYNVTVHINGNDKEHLAFSGKIKK